MTIITLHHLCFGHCVNSSVIVLDLGIFVRELRSLRKIPRSKKITSDFTQWPQNYGAQLLLSKYKMACQTYETGNLFYYWQEHSVDHHLIHFEHEHLIISSSMDILRSPAWNHFWYQYLDSVFMLLLKYGSLILTPVFRSTPVLLSLYILYLTHLFTQSQIQAILSGTIL